MLWDSAVRGTILTHVLLMAGLTSVCLSWWTFINLISTIQNYLFDLRIWITCNCSIRTSSIYQRSIRQRSSELNFFCCEAFEILAFFFLAIVISLLICLCLSLSVLWKPAKSYPARARSARARKACALRAVGLLLSDRAPTVGRGKTFWRVN